MDSNVSESLLSRHYIDYVYVPGFLLILGTTIVKREWVPYAAGLALVLGAYNFWNFRAFAPKAPPYSTRLADIGTCIVDELLTGDVTKRSKRS